MKINEITMTAIIPIAISLVSLLLSTLSFFKDNPKIKVYVYNTRLIKDVQTPNGKSVFPKNSVGMGVELKFINTSKYPIGYFDLIFRDASTKKPLPCFDKMTLSEEDRVALYHSVPLNIKGEIGISNIMENNEDIVPSFSIIRKETIVFPTSENIIVEIKFAKFSLVPNLYSKDNRFCKYKRFKLKMKYNDFLSCKIEGKPIINN